MNSCVFFLENGTPLRVDPVLQQQWKWSIPQN